MNTTVSKEKCIPGDYHQKCSKKSRTIPRHMGWMWKPNEILIRPGWKPGSIHPPIRKIMQFFANEQCYSLGLLASQKPKPPCKPKPVLNVCKIKGDYIITMRPNFIAGRELCPDPCLNNNKPIQFRIGKLPVVVAGREIKAELKKCFKKCTCHKPIYCCECRGDSEKFDLMCKVKQMSKAKGVPNVGTRLVLSETSESDSDLEFNYSPPIEEKCSIRKRKIEVASRGTQYNLDDLDPPPPKPKPRKCKIKQNFEPLHCICP